MDVESQLKKIITDQAVLDQVLLVVGKGNVSMQKYRKSESYKQAQKKAVAKFLAAKQTKIESASQHILTQLNQYSGQKRTELLSESDDDTEELPKIIVSMSELWRDYNATTNDHGGPTLTRAAYCKLFPANFERLDTYTDASGKKHYNVDSAVIAV